MESACLPAPPAAKIPAVKVPAGEPLARLAPNHEPSVRSRLLGNWFLALVLLPSLWLLSGCSGFNYAWRKAGEQQFPTDSISGRWEGQWLSEVNGHNGALRCLITATNDTACLARFRATYAKVLNFSYTVPLNLQPHFEGWEFDGEEDLGKLGGGTYYYEGRANATNFSATYRSQYDHGTFEMRRVQ